MTSSRLNINRRDLLYKGAAGAALGAVVLAVPDVAHADVSHDSEQIGKIYQLQAAFHHAKSHQDIDLMMSLWADDCILTLFGSTYIGNGEVRAFFLRFGSWVHPRLSF